MTVEMENLEGLERRLPLSIPVADVNKEVEARLRKLARTVKMPGFRPGKVPLKLVQQSYGSQVNAEVIGDAVGKAFNDAVNAGSVRVAGQPRIEPRDGAAEGEFAFSAVFEVYPEIAAVDPAGLQFEKVSCAIGDAEIDKTVDVLRKQRVSWAEVARAAQDGDQVTIDFVGSIDGVAFQGGSGENFSVVLGEGRMLPDFEAGIKGGKPDEKRTFPVAFPADYGASELAGKQASFDVTVRKVEEPILPTVDAEFAKALGVEDGDVQKMRDDIRKNLEREVGQRIRGRIKSGVMEVLASSAGFDLPKALVAAEGEALADRARQDLAARGMNVKDLPVPADAFKEQAERRVRLGLLVGELVEKNDLRAKPDQIRKQIEEFSQAYENPAEVVRYYFSDRDRLAEVEALVVEQNVVDWALEKGQVTEKALTFDELMSAAG
ncbi:MAG: trigger factor [Burkholderiaceae bacterium]|nr:trigger factor [Burkholderiaceae bacterium]